MVNPRDEEALKRIINFPARGIGKTTIDKAILAANENNISMWEVLENAAKFGFRSGTLQAIEEFVTMIKSFASMLKTKNAYEVAFHVGKQTNIIKELFNDKSTEGVQRYENIQELLNSIKEWTESPDNEEGEVGDKGLGSYLQQITLLTDADEKDPDADTVKLMTIHAAKGLEFECVFACGLEEMLFPNAMSINTREELEEERRLFYVAMTRAKKYLYMTLAKNYGGKRDKNPSGFLNETGLKMEVLDEIVEETLAANGLSRDAIDWLVPHQANLRIIQAAAKKLGLGMEKVVVTVDRHANTSAASIPLALDEAARDGRIRPGQHVLMEAIGGGFTWGAVLAKW
jgi:DNA helicase-2/ATP-dependent DNA helicase PcrA